MTKKSLLAASALAGVLVLSSGSFALGRVSANADTPTVQPILTSAQQVGPAMLQGAGLNGFIVEDRERGVATISPLLERTTPAVVNIAVESTRQIPVSPLMRDPFFREFFQFPDQPREQRRSSAGSGVIVDAHEGYVLTNHHVVGDADSITVTLKDGRRLEAELLGSDDLTDIALLKVNAENLTALPLATETEVRTGDYVIAIGNPFGLGQTVTSGIVSATGRTGLNNQRYEDFIQTDAPINPGNSGGALVNSKGELIGINTAIIAPAGGNVGIGFAVPVDMAKGVMDQLIEHGEVRRGRIGVSIQTLTPDLAEALDLEATEGAVVSEVVEDSPSDKAGIKPGDVIIALNGEAIRTSSDLRNAVGLTQPDSKIELTVLRDGRERRIGVTVGDLPEPAEVSTPRLEGASITELPPHIREDVEDGVYIAMVEAGSPAWRAGLRQGDVILEVNRRAVDSVDAFNQRLSDIDGAIALTVQRGPGGLFLVLR
ncbi:DegQ family serine endoprotease [Hyphomonas sp.]|nr:DegQ family serine endoprotease [Hyphomonas sp.]MAB10850.1 serine endoprotease DegQ [Hyphomonas sp.]MAU67981.1 serine endoprotease DegQ [Hyphomonas sp.]MBM59701.1 serine endoprotease DegQ [Hyphomonas sp.]